MKTLTFLSTAIIICLTALTASNVLAQANCNLSNLCSPTSVNQHLLPGSNNSRNLGSTGKSWKDVYLDGSLYLDDLKFISGNPGLLTAFFGNAGNATSSGYSLTFAGNLCGLSNTTGSYNSFFGNNAGYSNTTGNSNSFFGDQSGYSNTDGSVNSFFGLKSGYQNTSGVFNAFFGAESGSFNSTGHSNSFFGALVGTSNTSGINNSFFGQSAGAANTTANNNSYFGLWAGVSGTTGDGNCFFGSFSGQNNITGSNNTYVGYLADGTTSSFTNSAAIGNSASVNANNKIRFGNSAVTIIEGTVAYTISDGRFKTNVTEEVKGLEFIKKLRPVVYNFEARKFDEFLRADASETEKEVLSKTDYSEAEAIRFSGFIAQEVEQAAKEVGYDFNGVHVPVDANDNYSLAYAEFVVPLVKAVQEQQLLIENQHKIISDLQVQVSQLQKLIAGEGMTIGDHSDFNALSDARLEQNAPNPFNTNSTIKFYVPEAAGNADLLITDEKGILLKSLAIDKKGWNQILINAFELSAGTYSYSLIIDGKTIDTRKMILTK